MTSSKGEKDVDKFSGRMLEMVVSIITLPSDERLDSEIVSLAPWLCKRSPVLQQLPKDVLVKLIRQCDYIRVQRDNVIIRQGDKGDCFYIQLSGKTSLYINEARFVNKIPPAKNADQPNAGQPTAVKTVEDLEPIKDEWIEELDGQGHKKMKLDRSKFGHFVKNFEAGKSFGELALITDDAVRSASVIADDATDLMVIKKQLFDDTLKAKQEEEFRIRKSFIDHSCLFSNWMPQMKRLLEISLRKEYFPFDSYVVKQGQRVTGLYFIIRGEAKITVNTAVHQKQYAKLMVQQEKQETYATSAHSRRASSSAASQRPGSSSINEQVRVRRQDGYSAAERRVNRRLRNVCVVGPGEIIGAIEYMAGLATHAQDVIATRDTEVFILDLRNVIRIIYNNKQIQTIDILYNIVLQILWARSMSPSGSQVELYGRLIDKLEAKKPSSDFYRPPTSQDFSVTFGDDVNSTQDLSGGGRSARRSARGLRQTATRMDRGISGLDIANVYYRSQVVEHSSRINLNHYQKSDLSTGGTEVQPRPPLGTMTRDAFMMVTKHAARLLPRSRRQLERLVRGNPNDPTTRSLRDPGHAVHRYLDGKFPSAGRSRRSRATSTASSKSRLTGATGANRPLSAATANSSIAVKHGFTLRPSSAVAPVENKSAIGDTLGKFRPHTALAAVKLLHSTAAPDVTDNSSDASVSSDDDVDQDSDEADENMEVMLGLSDAVLDDDVRDVVIRMNEHKQFVQASRRTAVNSVIDKRPPSGKRSQQRRDSETSDDEEPPPPPNDGDHFDQETSDEALRHLEEKLRNFYNNNEPDGVEGRRKTAVVQQMKRFSVKVCNLPPDQETKSTQ